MNRIVTLFAVIVMSALATHAAPRKGRGCWRSVPKNHAATTRLQSRRINFDGGVQEGYTGQKRGLVILAEFPDAKFKRANDREKYQRLLNEPGYTTGEGFRGSVADYFRDQSAGQFLLTFDVAGPYTAAHEVAYYGQNSPKDDLDLRPEELIKEMCIAADGEVDFADYDWDGDGEVDEVFVVYAGKGEADSYGANAADLIWPHMWTMEESPTGRFWLDGQCINVYACCNEVDYSGSITGIGTICHEFSHCLGLPDFYSINDNNVFGMGRFDLMDSGNYNGNGFCPPGYTAYEKMVCGWQQPIVLSDKDVTVSSISPISEHGDTYIIYNDANPDEFYTIENRQHTGWDKLYPRTGLMILHVDYDAEVWFNNLPNTIMTLEEALKENLTCGNDRLRMTIFAANDNDRSPRLYPYQQRDSLTATSTPAATLHTPNSEGSLLMQGAILNITQHTDGTMSFDYRAGQSSQADAVATLRSDRKPATVYTLDGRAVRNADATSLGHGIYIVDGRKVVR